MTRDPDALFLSDGQVAQTPQDGSTFVLMSGSCAVISVGSDMIFASPTGHSTIIAAGLHATGAGYLADTVVLSDSGTADVLLGVGDLVYGGAGHAVLTWTAGLPSSFVAGRGDYAVLGNPTGQGISYAGGIASVTHTAAGTDVRDGAGGIVHLYAAGPVA